MQSPIEIIREKPQDQKVAYILSTFSQNPHSTDAIQITQNIEKIDITDGMYPDGTFKKVTKVS